MNDNFNLEKQMFNSSAISTYMGCPKLFYWEYIRRLTTKEPKLAMEFGSTFHEVLLEWYRTNDAEKAIKKFESLPVMMGDSHLNRDWGEAVFKEYIKRYKEESGETLHLEVKFRIEIGSRIYSGTIDRIEDWSNQIYIDDHKTTKMLGLSFFEAFRPHPQIDGYCYVGRELVGRCAGAVINGISTAKNPKERFQRFISNRSDEEMNTWKTTFTNVTDDIMRDVERYHFPMRTTWCNRWGACRFKDLCIYHQVDKEKREKYIEDNYVVREEPTEGEVSSEQRKGD